MPIGDPQDGFYYPTLTLIVDIYTIYPLFNIVKMIGRIMLTWQYEYNLLIYWNNKVMSAWRLRLPFPNAWTHFIQIFTLPTVII